ncbi:MAG: 5-formyltetrahydrofolate cyclo-ligase [Rubellimicrobium sp.]|nr:5-formyltetrahydrofolate cyclo-ligase [Rubellimicrobium sp.]
MTADDTPKGYASPACMAGEIAPGWFGEEPAVDAETARDVARWRKAQRQQALDARAALSVAERQVFAERLAEHLDALLAEIMPEVAGRVIAGYWPIKSEPDLRPWLIRLQERGAVTAMPVVAVQKAPLVFKPWKRGDPITRGHWNIPEPATDETVTPDLALAPFLGWDGEGYRLGYGGGYYDRTLAQISPVTVGIGLHDARLATIFPQPHDIALTHIVTEEGRQV